MIYYINDYNGGSIYLCDYLFERIKKETQKKIIMRSGYLIVKGLVKKDNGNDKLFNSLDKIFEIPQPKEKPKQTEQELIDDFKNYLGR